MKGFLLLVLGFMSFLGNIYSLDNSKVFAFNLMTDAVNIQIGDDSLPVLKIDNLATEKPSPLYQIDPKFNGNYRVYYKNASMKERKIYVSYHEGNFGETNLVKLEPGKAYCLLANYETIRIIEMTDTNDTRYKLAVICRQEGPPLRIEITRAWNNNPVLVIEEVMGNSISGFHAVNPGANLIYWGGGVCETPNVYQDKAGNIQKISFQQNGKYNLFYIKDCTQGFLTELSISAPVSQITLKSGTYNAFTTIKGKTYPAVWAIKVNENTVKGQYTWTGESTGSDLSGTISDKTITLTLTTKKGTDSYTGTIKDKKIEGTLKSQNKDGYEGTWELIIKK